MWTAEALLLAGWLAAMPTNLELEIRRNEADLLHRRVPLSGLLQRETKGRWRPAEPARARVYLVHLWAVDCASCIGELNFFRAVSERYRRERGLELVFISENDVDILEQFLADPSHRDVLPPGRRYRNANGVRAAVHLSAQPLTLLLDGDLVVRQGFVGTLEAGRKNEFITALERLLAETATSGRKSH